MTRVPFMKHMGLKKESLVTMKWPFFDAEQKASLNFRAAEQVSENYMSSPSERLRSVPEQLQA